MLPFGEPKWRRRKSQRPAEIIAAALEVFSEKGFAAAKLDEIARLAGVSKGALYLYFETKEDLFRAVVQEAVAPNVSQVQSLASVEAPFGEVLRTVFGAIARLIAGDRRISSVAKVVICESRNFPELARIWHETVVSRGVGLLSALIARGQARGEVREGDPRYFAFGLMGPVLLSIVWRETFEPIGADAIDVEALVAQHLDTVIKGLEP